MGTISDKLTYLNATKTAIKQAIIAKGVDVADTDTFRSYASKIEAIENESGSGDIIFTSNGAKYDVVFNQSSVSDIHDLVTVSFPSSLAFLNASSITFSNLQAVEDAGRLCYNCTSVKTINFPVLQEINRSMGLYQAFGYCSNLSAVLFPQLTTISSYSAMRGAFSYTKVTSLDLPKLKGELGGLTFADNSTLRKIWLPKEVTYIYAATDSPDYSYKRSPFYNCSTSLVIYTDAAEKLEGWSDYCFNVSETEEATVIYGAAHEDFENAEVS